MSVGSQTSRVSSERSFRISAPSWWRKPVIYRFARSAHSYLSAFAFIGLMFFSATGFLLNHPDWMASKARERTSVVRLDMSSVAKAVKVDDDGRTLGRLVMDNAPVTGAFSSAEIFEDEAMMRFTGVKGDTDVFLNLETGEAEIERAQSGVMSIIRDLHRGKEAGAVWRLLIDVIAIVTLALSAIGFFLFFTMKFRLAASLKLTGASLALMVGLFVFFVA